MKTTVKLTINRDLKGLLSLGPLTTPRSVKVKTLSGDRVEITRKGYSFTTGTKNFGGDRSHRAYAPTEKTIGKVISKTVLGSSLEHVQITVEISSEDARRLA